MNKKALIFWGGVSLAVHATFLSLPASIKQTPLPANRQLQVSFVQMPTAPRLQTVQTTATTKKTELSPVQKESSKPSERPQRKRITPPPAPEPRKKIPALTAIPESLTLVSQPDHDPDPPVSIQVDDPSASENKAVDTARESNAPVDDLEQETSAPANTVIEASPLYAQNSPPAYPRMALERGWEGEVLLRLRIGRTGRVLSAKVERSSKYALLDRAALNAVRQWRFHPAQKDDAPIEDEVRLPIRFELRTL